MIIITWCLSKMRSAYAAGKRAVTSALSCCSGSAGQVDGTYGSNNVPVNVMRISIRGEQIGPTRMQSVQRRRPDVPMVKGQTADPERAAAVMKACKELRVPVGDDVSWNDAGSQNKSSAQGTAAVTDERTPDRDN
ncbi:uncharacterized protein LOC112691599 [Sipha flava]|uniref:Uncharacterized protein LOC112691599 n=2 Tax=Sipha flava TaxID=143950 RepID=A0A8B8GEQ4_9HEMI|nr:uncharacterized protein LOC112691599 [Sipha flava]